MSVLTDKPPPAASWLKHPLFDAVHEGFAEFFADGDLFGPDEHVVIPDRIEPGDIDDVGVMDARKRGRQLFFDIF
jgi:hypothetical protein